MSERHLILFDCDGTLVQSHQYIIQAMQQALAAHDEPVPSDAAVAAIIGLSLEDAIAVLCDTREKYDAIAHDYRTIYTKGEHKHCLYDGVVETLSTLQEKGYSLGIITGKSLSGLLRVLDQFSIRSYFDVWRTADCCLSKPHPEMVLECIDVMNVRVEQTTVIGDAVFDMQMAKSANVRSVGVSFGVGSSLDLYDAGAMHVVDHFSELLQYVPHVDSDY